MTINININQIEKLSLEYIVPIQHVYRKCMQLPDFITFGTAIRLQSVLISS